MRGRTESLVQHLPPSLEQKLEFFPTLATVNNITKNTVAFTGSKERN